MSSVHDNIYFLGVARFDHSQIVIPASYSSNAGIDMGGIKQVVKSSNQKMAAGKHYAFSVENLTMHLMTDDIGLIYVMVGQAGYPLRCAVYCLNDLHRQFSSEFGNKAVIAIDNSLDRAAHRLLKYHFRRYDDLNSIDQIVSVSQKVTAVKLVMQDNIQNALSNCVQLDKINKQAEELQQSAGVFRRNTIQLRNKMWWKELKIKLLIGFFVLLILGIIVGVIVSEHKK